VPEAVIFDLDGVLLDSERLWDRARRAVAAEHGGEWRPGASEAMQGMSSPEWSRYLHDELGVALEPEHIVELVVSRLLADYRQGLPTLPGAELAVPRLAARWPLGLASSANRTVIDEVLDMAGWRAAFDVTLSSEEVPSGKPAPDVYLEAARRLGRAPAECVAVEDSANGIVAAVAAGSVVVAIPNRDFPPPGDVLATAGVVIESLDQLTVELVAGVSRPP
jgi:HAD superfamily hydrolase (TIGR01509 family)